MPRLPRKPSPGHFVDELQRTTAALEAVLHGLEVQRAALSAEVREQLRLTDAPPSPHDEEPRVGARPVVFERGKFVSPVEEHA